MLSVWRTDSKAVVHLCVTPIFVFYTDHFFVFVSFAMRLFCTKTNLLTATLIVHQETSALKPKCIYYFLREVDVERRFPSFVLRGKKN